MSSKISTRGQHTPFFLFDPDGEGPLEDEVVGTTGIFVILAVDAGEILRTGASNIGNAVTTGVFAIDGTK
jgi:hypothetical protein